METLKLMKKLLFILLLLPSIVYGQATLIYGTSGTRSTDTAKTLNTLFLPKYATADTNKVLGLDARGMVVLRTKGTGGSGSTTLEQAIINQSTDTFTGDRSIDIGVSNTVDIINAGAFGIGGKSVNLNSDDAHLHIQGDSVVLQSDAQTQITLDNGTMYFNQLSGSGTRSLAVRSDGEVIDTTFSGGGGNLQTVTDAGNETNNDIILTDGANDSLILNKDGLTYESDSNQSSKAYITVKKFNENWEQHPPFLMGLAIGNQPPELDGTTVDPNWVHTMGFNTNASGGRVDGALPLFSERMEYNWHISEFNRQMEKYTQIIWNDGTSIRSPFMIAAEGSKTINYTIAGAVNFSTVEDNNFVYAGFTGGVGNTTLQLISTADLDTLTPATSLTINITDTTSEIAVSDAIPFVLTGMSSITFGSAWVISGVNTSTPVLNINGGQAIFSAASINNDGGIASGTTMTAGTVLQAGTLFQPAADNNVDIGIAGTQRFKDLYLSSTGNMNTLQLTSGSSTSKVTFGTAGRIADPTNATNAGTFIALSESGTNPFGIGLADDVSIFIQDGASNGNGLSLWHGDVRYTHFLPSGVPIFTGLSTLLTAPTTTGTLKMVVTDEDGLLSFDDIPSGGSADSTTFFTNYRADTMRDNIYDAIGAITPPSGDPFNWSDTTLTLATQWKVLDFINVYAIQNRLISGSAQTSSSFFVDTRSAVQASLTVSDTLNLTSDFLNFGVARVGDPTAGVNAGTSIAFNFSGSNAYGMGIADDLSIYLQGGASNGNGMSVWTGATRVAGIDGAGVLDATKYMLGADEVISGAGTSTLSFGFDASFSKTIISAGTTPVVEFTAGVADFDGRIEVTSTTSASRPFPIMTATQASALTPTNGDFVIVSDTNGTFTSVGLWFYNVSAWELK